MALHGSGFFCLNVIVAKTFERAHKVPFFPGYRQRKFAVSSVQASRLWSLRPCNVIGDDSKEGSSGGESIVLDAQTLERDLDIAIAEEDYAKAAQIRDSLKLLMQDSLTSVRTANAQFYEAFRIGDLAAMQVLWAQRKEVCCVHPGARGIYGYEDVMTSWDYVWANYEFPLEIELKDVNVYVRGDVGCVSCVELVKTKGSSWGGQFATNVFEKIDGKWFICIHHASVLTCEFYKFKYMYNVQLHGLYCIFEFRLTIFFWF
ncbi:hypothetical protein D8674_041195 [Pyrus ussuriensis x Pyrus communis]|uniref:SnoaL-like domain-containing protein n=1 Tax=Pyrus ussuriensis x Pyrus communis TaxID=2448454 RepID=A0A5N5F7W4_9ROSA|nr:hypothetical protein D8674_041195 [Pyrus ussuriensis x Pyrus communis]